MIEYGNVVVAEHYNRTIGGIGRNKIKYGGRIGTVTKDISEKCKILCPRGFGMIKTGSECLQIAMDIRKQG